MLKKAPFILALIFLIKAFTAAGPNNSLRGGGIVLEHEHFSPQQLLDTANYYFFSNSFDTALMYFNALINRKIPPPITHGQPALYEKQKLLVEAYNRAGIIYQSNYDYHTSYDYFIKALTIAEGIGDTAYKARINSNIGNFYSAFDLHDPARSFYMEALNLCQDSSIMPIILNNLGRSHLEDGKIDSAFYFLNKALQINEQQGGIYSQLVFNTMALAYRKSKQYDLAYQYFQLSLASPRKYAKIDDEAECLFNLGSMFFEMGKLDSALFYFGLSSAVAEENGFLKILADNHLFLSNIERSKGNHQKALMYFEKHINLKESVLNAEKLADINRLQRLYEVSKTNEQIDYLVLGQQIKEQTIYFQRISNLFMSVFLASISIALVIVFFQKRKLNTAYKMLAEKNVENISLQEYFPKKDLNRRKANTLKDDVQNELLNRILTLMEDTAVICDSEFSVDKLAVLVQYNQVYVSQVINSVLKKNFRSLLNDYRVKEAQRLFSRPDASKYTIEYVALMVGFKSRNTFYNAFKEVTGVTPNYYLRALQD